MRLELFGAIALATTALVACGEDQSTLGSDSTSTGGAVTGTGGYVAGNGGVPGGGVTGGGVTGGGVTGGGVTGGGVTGNGGFGPGNGGTQQGAGGTQQGAGGLTAVTCPTTAPNAGDSCTGFGSCSFGATTCRCRGTGMNGGRAWRCGITPGFDGGFMPRPRPDGGFPRPGTDGGPTTCTGAADCTTNGDVCCNFGGGNFCAPANFCRNPVP